MNKLESVFQKKKKKIAIVHFRRWISSKLTIIPSVVSSIFVSLWVVIFYIPLSGEII